MDSPASASTLLPIKLSSPGTREFWEIPVLCEDEDLLALNKPAGLAVAANPREPDRPSLMALLHEAIAAGKPWAATRAISFLMYAHRLDPEASGVLLLARNKPALTRLLNLFGSERAVVTFLTLASGESEEQQFSVEAKIGPHRVKAGLMQIDPKSGKMARTTFEVAERFGRWALLRCIPWTNRAQQVRVHLARAGWRVAGDSAYGGKPLWLSRLKPNFRLKPNQTERPLIGRPCVHAAKLETTHPTTGQPLVIEAAWPKELQVALKYLRKYAAGSQSTHLEQPEESP